MRNERSRINGPETAFERYRDWFIDMPEVGVGFDSGRMGMDSAQVDGLREPFDRAFEALELEFFDNTDPDGIELVLNSNTE